MAYSSRTLRNVTACVFVLCCLGGAAWFLVPEGRIPVVDEARNAVRDMTGADAGDIAPESSPSEVSGESKDTSARQERAAHEVTASLSDGPRPVPLDPQAELLARVDRAMAQPATVAADGDSTSGPVEDRPPLPDDGRKDSVVTPRFVSDMAAWLASGYVPSHHEGRSGRTSVTLIQANFRYSNSGTLRSVERDPLKSRSSILSYAFTPGMLEVLYQMYAPTFLEEMERAARESRRRTLSDAQVADMFDVYADRFRRLAVSLDAAASVDLPALSGAIRREAAHEAEANDNFAKAYMALSLARDRGDRDEVAIQSRRMAESTRVAGMYAERQERARNDMAYAIQRRAEGRTLSSSELLFLGEWLSRRNSSVEAVKAAADVCRRMAEQMHDRADEILHRRADESQSASSSPAATSATETRKISPEEESSGAKSDVSGAGQASSPTSAAARTEQTPTSSPVSSSGGKSSSKPSAGKVFPEVSGSLNFSPAPAGTRASGESSVPRPASSEGGKSSVVSVSSGESDTAISASAPVTTPATSSAAPAGGLPELSSSVSSAPATPAVPSASSSAAEKAVSEASGETSSAVTEAEAASSEVTAIPASAAASESAAAVTSAVPAGTSSEDSSSPEPSAPAASAVPAVSEPASKDVSAQP